METPRVYPPEHWHRRAEELRSLAVKGIHSSDARTLLMHIADEYDLLANRAETREPKHS